MNDQSAGAPAGPHDRAAFAVQMKALGASITPAMIGGTIALYAPYQPRDTSGVKIIRDLKYGEHERHRLDLFIPQGSAGRGMPVLMYLHGGGFVQGDKTTPGSPFYDNVGLWAAKHGCIGATMTYRLAPQHTWPAGSDDVGAAVRYLRKEIEAHGGDASKIFLIGQSAGAVHVAGYVAREQSPGKDNWKLAGAILVSGLYDTQTMDRNPLFEAYFSGALQGRPFLGELARTQVPLMAVIAEFDPPDFLRQFVMLQEAYLREHRRLPHLLYLHGHNHLSTVLHLNTTEKSLGAALANFMAAS